MVEVYYANAVFLLIPVLEWTRAALARGDREGPPRGQPMLDGAAVGIGAVAALISGCLGLAVPSNARGWAGRVAVPALLGILVLWNVGFIFQWATGLVANPGAVDFSVVVRDQMTVVPGRLPAFLNRYVREREAVTSEVEREGVAKFGEYHPRR
jgi:hypothetical protein